MGAKNLKEEYGMHPKCGWDDKFFWENSYELLLFYISPEIELTEVLNDEWFDVIVKNYDYHEVIWVVPNNDTICLMTMDKTDWFVLEVDDFYSLLT